MSVQQKLNELGITLPQAAAPAANYIPWTRVGNLIFISGQLPIQNGEMPYKGHLGANVSVEEGYQAARLCAINLIAQAAKAVNGDLEQIVQCVKLTGFVASTPDFTDQPKVINGASDLMVAVFGDKGRHARAAVGAPSLPFGVAVEVEAIFQVA